MQIPSSLQKKIAGVPLWGWILLFAAGFAVIAWRRRQAAMSSEDEPVAEDELGYEGDVSLGGGIPGAGYGGEGSSELSDGLSWLADLIQSESDEQTETLTGQLDTVVGQIEGVNESVQAGAEATVEAITDGFNGLNDVLIPDSPGGGGSDGGGGNGQLPDPDDDGGSDGGGSGTGGGTDDGSSGWNLGYGQQIRDKRDRVQELRDEIKRIKDKQGPLTKWEQQRIAALTDRIEKAKDRIGDLQEIRDEVRENLQEQGQGPDTGSSSQQTKVALAPLMVRPVVTFPGQPAPSVTSAAPKETRPDAPTFGKAGDHGRKGTTGRRR